MPIADLRREYNAGGLRRGDLAADPIAQFSKWFDVVVKNSDRPDANAMTLATADKNGVPSTRIVLLKGVDARGFTFFTNYESRKGRELTENPNAALNFFWPELERQVCIAGPITKVSREESEGYFRSRPHGSRLAALASNQSNAVADRAELEKKWQELATRYPDEVPLPPTWGGYVLAPTRIEFWQGRPNRLHDRFRYSKQADGTWKIERLAP